MKGSRWGRLLKNAPNLTAAPGSHCGFYRRATRCCCWPGEPAVPAVDTSHRETAPAGHEQRRPEAPAHNRCRARPHIFYVTSYVTQTGRGSEPLKQAPARANRAPACASPA